MTLILTEKPSVARDFAKALSANRAIEGYYKNSNYIITNCIGHLLTLPTPEELNPRFKKWAVEDLPIIPDPFKYKPIANTKDQLDLIKNIITTMNFDNVILATDAGREGELIGRLVFDYCAMDYSKVWRFWVSEALTPDVIAAGLKNIKPVKTFDKLAQAGKNRQIADWLVGMNYSRFFSIKMGVPISFGRVQTPVLNLIKNRDEAIEGFTSKNYFEMTSHFLASKIDFKGQYIDDGHTKFDTKDKLEIALANLGQIKIAKIESVIETDCTVKPPKLLNLTALQKEINTLYGLSAADTLKVAQTLYEQHKCLSYPRTPSRVLGDNNVELAKEKIAEFSLLYPDLFKTIDNTLVAADNSHVFNSKLLEDHHALIPLAPLPEAATAIEKQIFDHVVRSFAMVFHQNHSYKKLAAVAIATREEDNYRFAIEGKAVSNIGWHVLKANQDAEELPELPILTENTFITIMDIAIETKKTRAPARFTEATILSAMENPQNIDFDGKVYGLGTPATRADIIETLIRRDYITRSKKYLVSTEKGRIFCDVVDKTDLNQFLTIENTSLWEKKLEDDPAAFKADIIINVKDIINNLTHNSTIENIAPPRNVAVGICPKCGCNIIAYPKSYSCSGYKATGCSFTIWKTINEATITTDDVKALLANKTTILKQFKSKAGKTYEAHIIMAQDYSISMSFN